MVTNIQIRNWDRWQTYRKDRSTPPWIKIHRNLLSNSEWSMLSDAEKGQLVSMWIVAADKKGEIPGDPAIIRKICMLDKEPNIKKFTELGFLVVRWLSDGCQGDAAETEAETDNQRQIESIDSCPEALEHSGPEPENLPCLVFPIIGKEKTFSVYKSDIAEWQQTFSGVDVEFEVKKCRQWNIDNPQRRKTKKGIRSHISTWLGMAQDGSSNKGRRNNTTTSTLRDKAAKELLYGENNASIDTTGR